MFDTRPKSRTIIFTGLGLSAVIYLTVEAGASTWDGPGRCYPSQCIEQQANPPLSPHGPHGTSVSTIIP